jgi:hypothetical protein
MPWTCKSCGTKNPDNAPKCGKCGDKTGAPLKFYTSMIFGGGVVFFLMYIIGTFIGGTLVEFSVAPTDEAVFTEAKSLGSEAKTLESVPNVERAKAKEAAVAKARSQMSVTVRSVLFWFFPLLLFPVCGMAVGFVSKGRTVIEAALASLVGQAIGFAVGRFMFHLDIGWLELIVGLVVGFSIAGAGAYVGEAVQEKRERAVLNEPVEDFN